MTTSMKAMQLLLIGSIVLYLLLGFIGCSRKNTSSNVIRKAFVMSVNAGQEAEYEKRHRPIWPELEATLKNHGVVTYTIFLLPETRQLFGYVEFKDQAQWDDVAKTAICQKWWAHMKEVMPSNPDNSPVSTELHEVFHIEQ
jgi:L-rhamnose mutarotase